MLVVPLLQMPVLTSMQPVQTVQVPLSQVRPDPHAAQVVPPWPHCDAVVRVTHELPWQHPSGQLAASHEPGPASGIGMAAHAPAPVHCSVEAQAVHELPAEPHAALEVPARQTPWVSRQPSQVPPTQAPEVLQVAPLVQARQL